MIWGGVISDPQDRQKSTTRGVADINWEVEPSPPRQFPHCVTQKFGSLSIYLFMLIQNSLARTVFNTPKTCHITPLLASLHWLKIKERIEYKLLSLTYNILTTSQATYLHNLVSLQSPRGTRSSSIATLSRPELRNARNLVS